MRTAEINVREAVHDIIAPGDFAYLIAVMIDEHLERVGLTFDKVNTVRGVLGSITDEFYRRVVAPYEDVKIKENGDVFFFSGGKLARRE
jgi:hypothetical protein